MLPRPEIAGSHARPAGSSPRQGGGADRLWKKKNNMKSLGKNSSGLFRWRLNAQEPLSGCKGVKTTEGLPGKQRGRPEPLLRTGTFHGTRSRRAEYPPNSQGSRLWRTGAGSLRLIAAEGHRILHPFLSQAEVFER